MTETEIREALVKRLAAGRDAVGAAFIAELFVDGFARRADLVMANGKLSAFEIKSERDTLHRLQGQLSTYERLFERVTVVCAPKHLDGVLATANASVGVWLMCPNTAVRVVRSAITKPVTDKSSWLTFLPVDEIAALLRLAGKRLGKTRADLLEEAKGLPLAKIRAFVLTYLKRRDERIAAVLEARQSKRTSSVLSPDQAMQRVQAFIATQRGVLPTCATPRSKTYSSP